MRLTRRQVLVGAAASGLGAAGLYELVQRYPPTPAGLGVTVGWGLPYFRSYVPQQAELHLPVDRRASRTKHHAVRALAEAIRFPSDPAATILEQNDVAVLLRSDVREHVADAERTLFHDSRILKVTSIRRGFVGSDFRSEPSLEKQMAQAAGVDGADLIPDDAELFLGFTSTQHSALGPGKIANLETLGYVDLGPRDYFRHGTNMHVSHIFEDLASWYLTFDFRERVDTVFKPGLEVKPGTVTVSQGAAHAASAAAVRRDFRHAGRIGHSSSIQPTSRLERDVVAEDGTMYRRGTAIPQRVDFNTLDNPFAWSATPALDDLQ